MSYQEVQRVKLPMRLTVNGELHQLFVEPYYSLLDALRDELRDNGCNM